MRTTTLKLFKTPAALLAFAFSTISTAGHATPLPGANDPNLRAAASAWLAGEDIKDNLWKIGEIAASGNKAARIFANQIARGFVRDDFPDLDRRAINALFPPDRSGQSSFSPYYVDYETSLLHVAATAMTNATTAADWIAGAEIYRAADVELGLMNYLRATTGQNKSFDIEIATYIESILDDNSPVWGSRWAFYTHEHASYHLEYGMDQDRKDRWGIQPWSGERLERFTTALQNQSLQAIESFGMMERFTPDLYASINIGEDIRNLALTSIVIFDAKKQITGDDRETYGAMVVANAARADYLRPLLNVCETHCPESINNCMAHGALERLYFHSDVGLEPVISAHAYLNSRRATERKMRHITARVLQNPNLDLPQCLQTAATE